MAKISGHPVYFDEADQVWRWQDTRQVVNHERGCSVCGRALCMVRLARTTPRGFTEAGVDACLAPFVQALNNGGLQTIASCCGHGGGPATIILEDGREVLVLEAPAPGESFIRSTILAGHGPTLNKDSAIQTSGPDLRGALEKAAATLHDFQRVYKALGHTPSAVAAEIAANHAEDALSPRSIAEAPGELHE